MHSLHHLFIFIDLFCSNKQLLLYLFSLDYRFISLFLLFMFVFNLLLQISEERIDLVLSLLVLLFDFSLSSLVVDVLLERPDRCLVEAVKMEPVSFIVENDLQLLLPFIVLHLSFVKHLADMR